MDSLERLKIAVFSKQKVLAEIYSRYGQESVFDYVKSWPIFSFPQGLDSAMLGIVEKILGSIYGQTLANGIANQLPGLSLISTIDHHGILGSPFFLNSNLIFSLRPEVKYLICFSTAGVSLNNHTWPGSLLVTDVKNLQPRRFSFFLEKQKTQTVWAASKLTRNNLDKVAVQIKKNKFLSLEATQKLANLIEEIFSLEDIKDQPDFSRQACLASSFIWSKVFPKAPKLIYLPLENLVSDLLISNLQNQESIFYKLFLTPAGWQHLEKYFQGLKGAFLPSTLNKAGDTGSFLFWAVDAAGRRLHLCRAGEHLAGENFSLPLKAETITAALKNKTIYPTSLVCFLALLYYQLTCLGGFNQVNWLTEIKNKFVDLLKEMGEADLSEKIGRAVTDNFAETNLAFAFGGGRLYKPTLLDFYLKGDDSIYEKIQTFSKQISLEVSINSLLPEIYKVITASADRNPDLLSLDAAEIVKISGMEAKIKAVFEA